ncbi:MAG: hypothetical protein QXS92_03215, partial [Thermofilum sp.]
MSEARRLRVRVPAGEVTINPAAAELIEKAEREGVETAWHRHLEQQPQCGFGLLGICCRNCMLGPCRIDPFGYGPARGVCGADADTIVARNIVRMIAAGAASHSDHARDILHVFELVGEGKTAAYKITDPEKLRAVASALGIPVEGRSDQEIVRDLAHVLAHEFGKPGEEPLKLLLALAPKRRKELWSKLGVMPRAIDREVNECMHRTHMGVDADPVNLLLHGVRTSLADGWSGSMMATFLSDILFGTPKPVKFAANLGVLREDAVNIIVHGHNPILSMKIAEVALSQEMQELAKKYGMDRLKLYLMIGTPGETDADVPCDGCTACCTAAQFVTIGPDETVAWLTLGGARGAGAAEVWDVPGLVAGAALLAVLLSGVAAAILASVERSWRLAAPARRAGRAVARASV